MTRSLFTKEAVHRLKAMAQGSSFDIRHSSFAILARPRRRCDGTAVVVLLGLLCWSPTARTQTKPEPPAPVKSEPTEEEKRAGAKLIRQAATDSDEDLMEGVLRLMTQVVRKLDLELDAGEDTQSLQRQITNQLDQAIREAASRRRPVRASGPSASADKRRMPQGPRADTQAASKSKTESDRSKGSPTTGTGTPDADLQRPAGELRDLRRSWGHLPMREREEILQGVGEKFLEQYRAWIERYYRALQEPEE